MSEVESLASLGTRSLSYFFHNAVFFKHRPPSAPLTPSHSPSPSLTSFHFLGSVPLHQLQIGPPETREETEIRPFFLICGNIQLEIERFLGSVSPAYDFFFYLNADWLLVVCPPPISDCLCLCLFLLVPEESCVTAQIFFSSHFKFILIFSSVYFYASSRTIFILLGGGRKFYCITSLPFF